jgi:uncharacterized membrane protein YbhN (UPF0104 family)
MIFSKGRIIGLVCTLGTLVGAVLILHQIIQDDSLSSLDKLLRPGVLLLLFALYALHFLAEPLRWVVYSSAASATASEAVPNVAPNAAKRAPDFMRIFACFNTTALLSYSLPFKLGLPLRLFLLSHFLTFENMKVVKLMAVDGVFNLLCWGLIAGMLFFFVPEIATFFLQYADSPLVVLVLLVVAALAYWVANKKREQVLALVRAVSPGVALFVVVTLGVDVLLYGVRHVVLAQALAPDVGSGRMFIIGILATFAGIISTLPMGLGAYDATLVALLALYGVDVEVSLLLAVSNRLGMIGTSVILGVPSAFTLVKSDTKIAES